MPSQEPIDLFVYGTLLDPQRVAALTGRQFRRVEATLHGFERIESDMGYPFILPRLDALVQGVVLLNVDPNSLRRIDTYEAEGNLYRRQEVDVLVADQPRRAMAYVGHAIRAAARKSSR